MDWLIPSGKIDLATRPLIMGILNVTPDSFSEQGLNYDPLKAIEAARAMHEAGADIIDIGGESSRPGAEAISAEEECQRVLPVIKELADMGMTISIDTWKSDVAAQAVEAGAQIINDISGFRRDPELKAVAAAHNVGVIAMHMRGTPQTMQDFTDYDDLIMDINHYFSESIELLESAGVQKESIVLDPGIGFSKTVSQNLELIAKLDRFLIHGRPVLLGPSRKSFIGKLLHIEEPTARLWGTAASISTAVLRGARIFRVHDVKEMKQVAEMTMGILHYDHVTH